jgi:membrane protein
VKGDTAPYPEDPRKPDDPGDLASRVRRFIGKNALREFVADECTDTAAALAHYAVLLLFPGLLALVSLLGLFGQGHQITAMMLGILRDLGAGKAADDTIAPVITRSARPRQRESRLALGYSGLCGRPRDT